MADVLTIAEARKALRKAAGDTADDADITATYIPAVTAIVDSLAGPVSGGTGLTHTVDGGRSSVLLPSRVKQVTAVTVDGTALATSDYVVDTDAGIIRLVLGAFAPGQSNVVVTYDVLDAATANVKLAARIILRHLWQADQQGNRPGFPGTDADLVDTPIGYAIPRRAYELLVPDAEAWGFA